MGEMARPPFYLTGVEWLTNLPMLGRRRRLFGPLRSLCVFWSMPVPALAAACDRAA